VFSAGLLGVWAVGWLHGFSPILPVASTTLKPHPETTWVSPTDWKYRKKMVYVGVV